MSVSKKCMKIREYIFSKSGINNNILRMTIIISLIMLCVLIAFFTNIYMHINSIYTHFFYFPVILSALWYQKKSIVAALFLGSIHILFSFIDGGIFLSLSTVSAILRAVILIFIAIMASIFYERKAKKRKIPRDFKIAVTELLYNEIYHN